jgi:hypothetical protein
MGQIVSLWACAVAIYSNSMYWGCGLVYMYEHTCTCTHRTLVNGMTSWYDMLCSMATYKRRGREGGGVCTCRS